MIDRISSHLLIILFFAMLWLPTFDSIWHLDHWPAQEEKRKLAVFPSYYSGKKVTEYLTGLEHYFDDHFGFRNRLLHWNNHWKLKWFNESPVDMAMQGRDGWLFWAQDGMLADYSGARRFTAQDLNDWQQLLEARRDWLAARGMKYLFVVTPDKHTIYPEKLPGWVVKSKSPSKLDQLLVYLRAHSTVPLLDLRPALLAAKTQRATYLKTDTHWNNFGAFIGCEELVRSLQLPDVNPLPQNAFKWEPVVQRGGDLAVCLDQQNELKETQEILFTPYRRLPAPVKVENAGAATVVTRNPTATGKVVLFRDSFAEKWIPFLGYHFNEVIYFRQANWKKPWLEREKPNIVIDEMVERLFNNQNPRQLLQSDG